MGVEGQGEGVDPVARQALPAEQLHALREQLRPHLPASVTSPEEAQAVAVDIVLAVDERSFFISGWLHDDERSASRLTAVSPEGARVELLEKAFRRPRPDIKELFAGFDVAVERHGFFNFVELDAPSLLPGGWIVELVTASREIEAIAPDVVRDFDAVRNAILPLLTHEPADSHELTENHVHPALDRLQDKLASMARIDAVLELGSAPRSPATSILVPIYERTELLEFQLALLAQHPEPRQADLVYVLDSPELAERVEARARALHSIYGIPFRLAVMNRNAGVANARNLAASLARGRLLLLLDSDVFPDQPGWLGAMTAFHDATPGVGALAPKLLYEDGSIQHAGIRFDRDPLSETWENVHRFKGLSGQLEAAGVVRPVPAVTGACLMIDRELFEHAGGFSHAYVHGGCEDSDLCLRLAAEGRQSWYLPEVELYHLEAQSFPVSEQRSLAARYNSWLQTRLWDDRIRALSAEPGSVGAGIGH